MTSDNPRVAKRRPINVEPLTEAELLQTHERDMVAMLDDPESVPRPPTGVEEGVTERGGTRMVDILAASSPRKLPDINVDDNLRLGEPVLADNLPDVDTVVME